MRPIEKKLGKIGITANGNYDANITYKKLCMVRDTETGITYVSRKDVPVGISFDNEDYWQILDTNGYMSPITNNEIDDLIK